MEYEPVIGLEVHAQLLTESKIFCGCSTQFGQPPNTNVCPVCMGMPGVLPVLNRRVVEFTIMTGLALGCTIHRRSVWARKNYFYPDLPKGYQISQYELPICTDGAVEIELDGHTKRIGIVRIHMEEDAGKLIHDPAEPVSYVDFNRAGVPLMEIVSAPDIRSPEEAAAYLKELRDILVYLGVCDGNMEEGSLRCDANVSLRPVGSNELGVKTELKNMNSFRNVARALAYEIERQKAVLDSGGEISQETRLWDAASGKTMPMRGKEEAHDYRYFPDPDLLPLVIEDEWIEQIRSRLPELPGPKRRRFVEQYGIPPYDAGVLTSSRELADYFEAAVAAGAPAKQASNWIMSELLGVLHAEEMALGECKLTPEGLAELISMVEKGVISTKIGKEIFPELVSSGVSPSELVERKGLKQLSDEGAIREVLSKVFADHPKEVAQYKAGKHKLLGFFVGQVMKATRGQANPRMVNELARKMLEEE